MTLTPEGTAAELLAKLAQLGDHSPVFIDDIFFLGEVMSITGGQISVRPDSSASGVWIGPISCLGVVPTVTQRVLCVRLGTSSICLGAIDSGQGAGARIQTSGNVSISPNTWTTIGAFGTTVYDTGGLTVVGGRLTCAAAGLYKLSAGGTFQGIGNSTQVHSGGGGGGGTINISGITMSFNSSTTYSFGTVFWGDGGWILGPITFSPGGSNFFTIPGAGSYTDTDDDFQYNDRAMRILLNGSVVIAETSHPVVGNFLARMNIGTLYNLAVGDYIQLQVVQSNASNLNLLAGAYLAAHT